MAKPDRVYFSDREETAAKWAGENPYKDSTPDPKWIYKVKPEGEIEPDPKLTKSPEREKFYRGEEFRAESFIAPRAKILEKQPGPVGSQISLFPHEKTGYQYDRPPRPSILPLIERQEPPQILSAQEFSADLSRRRTQEEIWHPTTKERKYLRQNPQLPGMK